MHTKRQLSFGGLIASLLIVGISSGIFLQRQNIFDWVRLYNYQPPTEIKQLADATTMTTSTRKLFYVHHPVLTDRSEYSEVCPHGGEQTIVLGCYIGNHKIYLFRVNDARLKGVQEVTAAHETLHAAYDRLSAQKRQRIDELTASVLAGSTDQRFKDTIANYRQRDPKIVPNELHSIVATEIRSLPTELEDYYRQYFSNRSSIIDLSESYEKEFTRRRGSIADYDSKLQALKSQIDISQVTLDGLTTEINIAKADLEQKRNSNQIDAYNLGVPMFNDKIRRYNALVATTQGLITEYNNLVKERNTVVLEEQQLLQSLEGRSKTIDAQ